MTCGTTRQGLRSRSEIVDQQFGHCFEHVRAHVTHVRHALKYKSSPARVQQGLKCALAPGGQP